FYYNDNELKKAIDMIAMGYFSPDSKDLYKPIVQSLLDHGDHYLVLADYRSYLQAQDAVNELYKNQSEWSKRSILNTANMGKFSSDRAVREYAEKIWKLDSI
ncbi:MAG: glycogen/starch/alpha-glucan phosphorylase, partial [Spirochaetia bacterium]|nr:glycogen/starch/alpha-glucan phosphorylase [Spirochaetia bacterium]